MPRLDVDFLEAHEPGFLDATLASYSAEINVRLKKRYAVPFTQPYPETVKAWLAKLVTPEAYRKRGTNPQDQQLALVEKDRDRIYVLVQESADSNTGLFDLPLNNDDSTSAVTKGGPLGYSEQSPYAWADAQAAAARGEDRNG